jgi:hypothetical protein
MLSRGKRRGFLVVVLIMSMLFFLIAVAICGYLGVQYSIMGETEQSMMALYAADSGVQYAMALMGLANTSSSEKYFGYTNSYPAMLPRAFDRTTLSDTTSGAPYPVWNTIIPMEAENPAFGAMDYTEGDFAQKLLWDSGSGTAVYFTVVRAKRFPNAVNFVTDTGTIAGNLVPGQVFNPNQSGSYNEQVSGTKLPGTNPETENGNPSAVPPIPPGCPFESYMEAGMPDGCAEADKATMKHYHCRYTIKSIGEVWAYHWVGTSKVRDRVIARRTVMAEIVTREPIDKRSTASADRIVSEARVLRWYEVFR